MERDGDNGGNFNIIKNLLKKGKEITVYSNISTIKKVTGILLIAFGVVLALKGYVKGTVYLVNLGVGLIVVGWVLLIFAYERYVKYDITYHIFNDYIDLIKKLIKGLNIETCGVVIPPRENLKDGCIYLPLHENFKVNLSIMDDSILFVNSDNRDEMGLLFSPSGKGLITLLKKYRGDYKTLEDGDINDLLDYLDYLLTLVQIGSDVKVEICENTVTVSYRIEDNSLCKKLQREDLCRKYPCPICGAVVLIVAEFLNKVLRIRSIREENKRVYIELEVIEDIQYEI